MNPGYVGKGVANTVYQLSPSGDIDYASHTKQVQKIGGDDSKGRLCRQGPRLHERHSQGDRSDAEAFHANAVSSPMKSLEDSVSTSPKKRRVDFHQAEAPSPVITDELEAQNQFHR